MLGGELSFNEEKLKIYYILLKKLIKLYKRVVIQAEINDLKCFSITNSPPEFKEFSELVGELKNEEEYILY